jgi:hypothetical protein
VFFYDRARFVGVHFNVRHFGLACLENLHDRLVFAQPDTADLIDRYVAEFSRRDFFLDGVHYRICPRRDSAGRHSDDDTHSAGFFRLDFYFTQGFFFNGG